MTASKTLTSAAPVVTPDDIAAIIPVMLGSGVNLLGYYMFHGGRNPDAQGITLQESQRTGYPTDVPVKSYDFQAPLGEFGQQRASLNKLKLVHYFLADFGNVLAPMPPHRPDAPPTNPSDLSVPRISARTLGDQGFIFFNNHVRGTEMPSLKAFQVELKLPGGTVHIPEQPIALRSDAYGIWPVNLPLGAQTLKWSTAQLFKRVVVNSKTFYFFFAIDGVPAQFAFAKDTHLASIPASFRQSTTSTSTLVAAANGASGSFALADGTTLVLLSESQAEQVWRGDDDATLLSTATAAYSDHTTWTLESLGQPNFRFGLFGAQTTSGKTTHAEPAASGESSLFSWFGSDVAPFTAQVQVRPTTPAGQRPPLELGPSLEWRKNQIPFAPEDKDFATAANWTVKVPALPPPASGVADVFLRIQYHGDAARLYRGTQLLDDSFWNGLPWEVGLRETLASWPTPELIFDLRILPLPADAPMYLEKRADSTSAVPATLHSVTLVPEYRINVLTTPQK